MRRALVLAVTATTAAAVATAGGAVAQSSGHGKTKVLKGGYQLVLPPDPTMEATGQVGMECFNVDPASADNHPLTLPAKGTIKIDLASTDPTGNLDWDLYLLDAKGNTIGASNGSTSQEEVNARAGKGKVTIRACNLMGQPTASVSYVFTFKK
ncbi:MAG TPA: hypothetical protein VH274_06750 [Mycobacteriales bacterium]|nr:hypothetical protein [Mycobacteriales bacterium]